MPEMKINNLLNLIEGFDWTQGNIDKNLIKHFVSVKECEESFFNEPIIFFKDEKHSETEKRYGIFGHSNRGRKLTIIFMIRNRKIRVISARDQSKKKGESMVKNKKIKRIPKFKTEDQERFWVTHDATEYFDMSKSIRNPIFANLKPSSQSISLRLPKFLLESIKQMANKRDVPYQSLMKMFLADRVEREHRYRAV